MRFVRIAVKLDQVRQLTRVTSVSGLAWLMGLAIATSAVHAAFQQYETINVVGIGEVATETDYVPNVVYRENGAASYEALKAQAVAARTYAYYKIRLYGTIYNGTQDQVYGTGYGASPQHYAAAADTEGEILTIRNYNDLDVLIAAFYVAGAIPTGPTPEPYPWDNDYSGTEHYVTHTYPTGVTGGYNYGTTLGFQGTVSNPNWPNRGCKSQNGANWMGQHGYSYVDILKYYYGADIQLETVATTAGQAPLQNLKTLTDFELNNGYFGNAADFSNYNLNLGAGTSSQRDSSEAYDGSYSQRIDIDLDEASGSEFLFHHVAGTEYAGVNNMFTGQREANLALQTVGSIGFWLMTESPDLTVALNLDDDYDGTEQSTFVDVIADGQWHRYEWSLEDASLWSSAAYDSGDGVLGDSISLDSILFAGNADSIVYLDEIFYRPPSDGIPDPIPGDIDGDGFVGLSDLDILLSFWNQNVPKGDISKGDLAGIGDGYVGLSDLNVILNNWNASTPPADGTTAVPEPGTVLMLGVLGLISFRRV